MSDFSMKPARSRTFSTRVVDREYGVTRSISTHTIKLWKDGHTYHAEIDGIKATVQDADRLLRSADRVEVIAEELAIGKAEAHRMHKELAHLGLHEHYGVARRVLGREVFSLATLTHTEAAQVWDYLRRWYMGAA